MKTDFGTNGYSQWFFFRVSNMRRGMSYKFNIMNMLKSDCLYNQGMKILCNPTAFSDSSKFGWRYEGKEIAYYKNCVQRRVGLNYYTLTFTIVATTESMHIASNYPYTYSDLMNLVRELSGAKYKRRVRVESLCKTPAGNQCPLLTITDFRKQGEKKPAVIFTARVHPG